MTAAEWAARLRGEGTGMRPPWRQPTWQDCQHIAAVLERAARIEEAARALDAAHPYHCGCVISERLCDCGLRALEEALG